MQPAAPEARCGGLRQADAFASSVAVPDQMTVIRRHLVLARAHLLRGSTTEAKSVTRRALKLLAATDLVTVEADAQLMLSDVLAARDLDHETAAARRAALSALQAKANVAAVDRLRPGSLSPGGPR